MLEACPFCGLLLGAVGGKHGLQEGLGYRVKREEDVFPANSVPASLRDCVLCVWALL